MSTSVVVSLLPTFSVDEKEKYYSFLISNVNNLDNRQVKVQPKGWKTSRVKQKTDKISTLKLISTVK